MPNQREHKNHQDLDIRIGRDELCGGRRSALEQQFTQTLAMPSAPSWSNVVVEALGDVQRIALVDGQPLQQGLEVG